MFSIFKRKTVIAPAPAPAPASVVVVEAVPDHNWLSGHADGDDWGDAHHVGDEDDPEDEGRTFDREDIERYVTELVTV